MGMKYFKSHARLLNRDQVNKGGLVLFKEVPWVFVGQREAELRAVKVGGQKKFCRSAQRGRSGFEPVTVMIFLLFNILNSCHTSQPTTLVYFGILYSKLDFSLLGLFVIWLNCCAFQEKSDQKFISFFLFIASNNSKCVIPQLINLKAKRAKFITSHC